MEYRRLAEELLESLHRMRRRPFPQEPMEISHGELGILMYLTNRHDGASAGDISKHLCLTTGRVAAALNSLERKGFIERRRDDADKRRVLVYMTDKGRTFAQKRHEEARRRLESLLRELGEHDAKEFVRILKRIHEMDPEEK